MDAVVSIKPVLAMLVSAIAAVLIMSSRRNPNQREFWSISAGAVKFLIVISMAPHVLDGGTLNYTLFTLLPGVSLSFKVDALGLLFATTASFLWILTTFYSIGYMRTLNEHAQTRYYTCFALALSAAIGVAFSANLFTLFLFYEVLSLSTYPLVMHKETPEAWEGAKKYVVYLMGTSKSFLLAAIVLTYYLTGTLDFAKGGIFNEVTAPALVTITYVLFIAGFAKAGIMPLHSWLPAAMVAPTPVSALLHAVAVVKVGVFSVLRVIFHVFGLDVMSNLGLGIATAYFVSITILLASVYALTQDNLKIRLAYSTVSQLSYIILGAALLTQSSITGGVIHIANHAFSKITLFFCAGSIYVAAHKTNISELSGIGKKMPFTMAAFALATLSMIGVPPVSGFITKWYLVVGSLEAGQIAILVVLLTSTVLNAAYFVPIIYKAFFEEPAHAKDLEHVTEAPYAVVIPLSITAVLSVLLGLYPDYFLNLIKWVV